MLLAFLPSLLYVDHWGDFLNAGRGGAIPPDHVAERLRQGGHFAHCHFGPATCSEQPVLTNMQAFPNLIELPEPEFPAIPLEDTVTTLEEFVVSPPTEPPRL